MHDYDYLPGETNTGVGNTEEGLHSMSLRAVGALPLGEAVDPSINPQGEPVRAYELGYLVRSLADEEGNFNVASLVDFLTGGEPVSEEDVAVLEEQIQEVAEEAPDITHSGEGSFTVSLPKPDESKEQPRYRPTAGDRQALDRMMNQAFHHSGPRWQKEKRQEHYQRAKRARSRQSSHRNCISIVEKNHNPKEVNRTECSNYSMTCILNS
jgi:hypothetical protein